MKIDGSSMFTDNMPQNSADLLNTLKPGDKIRAQVMENHGNELTLKLSDGSKVSAHAASPVDCAEGDFVNFVFKGNIDGKPVLEVVGQKLQTQVDEALQNIKNTLTGLKIPLTDQNIKLAQALKNQNIDITAESMSKIDNLLSQNKELKSDAAAFLTAANMSNDKNNIEKLQSLLAGRLKISDDLGQLLKLFEITDDLLSAKLTADDSNSAGKQTGGPIVLNTNLTDVSDTQKAGLSEQNVTDGKSAASNSNVSANSKNNSNTDTLAGTKNNTSSSSNFEKINANASNKDSIASKGINTNISENKTAGKTPEAIIKLVEKLIESTKNYLTSTETSADQKAKSGDLDLNSKTNTGTNINARANELTGLKSTSDIAQHISNNLKDGFPLEKADLQVLDSIKFQLEALVKKGELTTLEQSAVRLIAGEINSEIFKINNSQDVFDKSNKFVMNNTDNTKDIKEAVINLKNLIVKIDENSDIINPVKLYKDMADSIQMIKNNIPQLSQALRETVMNIVNNLESNMNFINQLNHYSSYVQIPLSIFNQNTTGELYMLKKGSKSKKLDPSNMTVLISLDSENIGRIDTLLSIDKKNISTNFRLENSDVFKVLKEKHKELYLSLYEKGYRLVDFTYRLMDEPVTIVNFEAEAKKEFIKNSNNIDIVI